MKYIPIWALLGLIAPLVALADDSSSPDLPFHRDTVNRYSLDHLPRSISIRQGDDVWLGYDLERAKIYKAWQAPSGAAGLKSSGFVVRSVGETWYRDASEATWRLRRGESSIPLTIRYQGIAQRTGYFELSWELRHEGGAVMVSERVATSSAPEADRVVREIRVEGLDAAETLLPPEPTLPAWSIVTGDGEPVTELSDPTWHRLTLP